MEFINSEKLNINFVSKFKLFAILSGLVMIASSVLSVVPGFNYGIDFRGGIEAHITFGDQAVSAEDVRALLNEKTANFSIVEIDSAQDTEFFITIQEEDTAAFSKFLTESLTSKYPDKGRVLKLDSVGPQVGAELRKSALLSMLYTCILICLYMYVRFDLRYAPGALLSVFHDIVVTLGYLAISRAEFSTATVAALLTLAGYSINDTVVVFDRIRELEGKLLGVDRKTLVNKAINSTLSRTSLTSFTTLMSCFVLYFVGGESLRVFSSTLIFGVLIGTYSSVFVAAPAYWATDAWMKRQPKEKIKFA